MIRDDVLKVDPSTLYKTPVIFVTGIVAALSTLAARNQSAILLAIIFNPRIIPALKRVKYRPAPAAKLGTRNLAMTASAGSPLRPSGSS